MPKRNSNRIIIDNNNLVCIKTIKGELIMKNICKNIFIGIGTVAVAIAIIVSLIAISPVLLVVGGTIIQIGGWILLFGIVVIFPIWGIGKIYSSIKNRKATTKSPEVTVVAEEEFDKDEEDYTAEAGHYEELYKTTIKKQREQEYKEKLAMLKTKEAKNINRNKKIENLKRSIKDLLN